MIVRKTPKKEQQHNCNAVRCVLGEREKRLEIKVCRRPLKLDVKLYTLWKRISGTESGCRNVWRGFFSFSQFFFSFEESKTLVSLNTKSSFVSVLPAFYLPLENE